MAGSVVYQGDDLLALLASNDNEDSSEIIGIATQGFAAGRVVNIQYSGPLTIQSWSWTAGAKVYVGVDGALTQTEPASGYVMPIGVAISPKTILIKIGGGGGGSGGASDAADLTYTPDDAGDWSPAPDDAAEALDQLAARAITSTINVDGASAEVYELSLSADQNNVTGNGAVYTVPWNTEASAKDWASVSAGSITVQAGTYMLTGRLRFVGGSTGDQTQVFVKIDSSTIDSFIYEFTDESAIGVNFSTSLTLSSESVLTIDTLINGDSAVYDLKGTNFTGLKLTRLPAQVPFSDVQEDSTTTRTLGLGDLGKWIEATNASGLEITVPPQSDVAWPLNAEIHGCGDSNAVTFVEGSGVTIKALSSIGPSMVWTLKRIATDEWRLIPQSGGKVLIEEITLGSAGEFDFNNIPQGFNRLVIEGYLLSDAATTDDLLRAFFNNDETLANYHCTKRYVYDTTSGQDESATPSFAHCPAANSPANYDGYVCITINNYAHPTIGKQAASRYNYYRASNSVMIGDGGLKSAVTDPITRVRIRTDNHLTDKFVGTLRLYGEM